MFNFAVSRESLLSGFQWFFFIFATRLWFLLRYFLLFSCRKVACLRSRNMLFLLLHWPASLRRSAVIVALLWEGPGGLWWGTILTITLGEASRGTPINDIATSGGGNCALWRADDVDWF